MTSVLILPQKYTKKMTNTHKTISKFLSLVLRHQPSAANIELDANGWADVNTLIINLLAKGFRVDLGVLQSIVANNEKQRFTFNQDYTKIRANQGHSVKNVDLEFEPTTPPDLLYHGTTRERAALIMQSGLRPQTRQHVHLSADLATATNVGSRHGKPFILTIDAKAMHNAKQPFYCSKNGVWLADFVPAEFISMEVG
jgi:putative RNA 2'-phosphotransferase